MTPRLSAALLSDTGCHRTTNEDAVIIKRGSCSSLLAVVADGMGGHSAGEVASRLAVDAIERGYYASEHTPAAALESAVHRANAEIYELAQVDRALAGMGTTIVALAIVGDSACAVNVGDSRLYLIRGRRIYQMTVDDSVVAEMVGQGLLSKAEARRHADKNVLLRALGTHPTVAVSSWTQPFPVSDGDTFVLTTDGLTDLVEDEELRELADGRHEADGCRALVDLARERGGFDNITVAIVRVARAARAVPVTRECIARP